MANSKRKCCGCKDRFPAEEMIIEGPVAWCSNQCKFNKKRQAKNKAIKTHFSRKQSEITVAQETEWLERITRYAKEHGAFPSGLREKFERHHVAGRKYVEKKVNIGRVFVLPMSVEYHNDSFAEDSLNVTNFKKEFENVFGPQELMFLEMCQVIREEDGELPFDEMYIEIIEGLIR